MKKRIIALFVCAFAFALMLCSCNHNESGINDDLVIDVENDNGVNVEEGSSLTEDEGSSLDEQGTFILEHFTFHNSLPDGTIEDDECYNYYGVQNDSLYFYMKVGYVYLADDSNNQIILEEDEESGYVLGATLYSDETEFLEGLYNEDYVIPMDLSDEKYEIYGKFDNYKYLVLYGVGSGYLCNFEEKSSDDDKLHSYLKEIYGKDTDEYGNYQDSSLYVRTDVEGCADYTNSPVALHMGDYYFIPVEYAFPDGLPYTVYKPFEGMIYAGEGVEVY